MSQQVTMRDALRIWAAIPFVIIGGKLVSFGLRLIPQKPAVQSMVREKVRRKLEETA
jgi:hypothetical protein